MRIRKEIFIIFPSDDWIDRYLSEIFLDFQDIDNINRVMFNILGFGESPLENNKLILIKEKQILLKT